MAQRKVRLGVMAAANEFLGPGQWDWHAGDEEELGSKDSALPG